MTHSRIAWSLSLVLVSVGLFLGFTPSGATTDLTNYFGTCPSGSDGGGFLCYLFTYDGHTSQHEQDEAGDEECPRGGGPAVACQVT